MSMRNQFHTLPAILLITFITAPAAFAARPPDLPGEEITNEYIRQIIPQDSIATRAPQSSKPAEASWLDQAMKTWDAPQLSEQIASDNVNIPMGKGAIFIPRMTEANLEPDIEIIDDSGNVAGRGPSGRNYAVLPGRYYVMFGSGTHKQRMVRPVDVIEGKPMPVIPDWAGLSIDVVDQNGIAYRGDYELARIDQFEPLGRGYGPDPELGEETKTWILKPGLYKIFGVGENFNTLKNFVTVQLLPGQFTKFLLIEDPAVFNKITGGGVVDLQMNRSLAKYWKYGIDIGGNILFNAKVDHLVNANNTTTSTIAILFNSWLRYERSPFDWNTNLKLDEGFALSEISFKHPDSTIIEPSIDEPRLTSLFIWRILPWLGPYGRFEATSTIFAKRVFPDRANNKSYFFILKSDSTRELYDDKSMSRQREPSFSPTEISSGIGANMDLVNVRYLQARLRTGFAYWLSYNRRHFAVTDTHSVASSVKNDTTQMRQIANSTILFPIETVTENNLGPEVAAVLDIRLGSWATAKSEARIFIPLAPEANRWKPKLDIYSVLSWQITRAVALDYQYSYAFNDVESLHKKLSEHRVIIRYSYTSR